LESYQQRILRFLNGSPDEIWRTLLNSINNLFLPDLRFVGEHKKDRIVFLGTHAVIQTVSKHLFGKKGLDATEFYLKHFVDGEVEHLQFSKISRILHKMRNVLAHQWLSSLAYEYVIDYNIDEGWVQDDDGVHINPDVYLEQFLSGWGQGGRIWAYDQLLSLREREIARYRFLADWLQLGKSHPLRKSLSEISMQGDETGLEAIAMAFKDKVAKRLTEEPDRRAD